MHRSECTYKQMVALYTLDNNLSYVENNSNLCYYSNQHDYQEQRHKNISYTKRTTVERKLYGQIPSFPAMGAARSSLYLKFISAFPGVGLSTQIENLQMRNSRNASSSGSY